MATGLSETVLRRMAESTRGAWREERRPGGSYDLTHKELLGLQQICARLCRGPRIGEREQASLGRMLHRLLNAAPHRGGYQVPWHEPVYGLIRKRLAVISEPPQR
jgi:hypothetical protein